MSAAEQWHDAPTTQIRQVRERGQHRGPLAAECARSVRAAVTAATIGRIAYRLTALLVGLAIVWQLHGLGEDFRSRTCWEVNKAEPTPTKFCEKYILREPQKVPLPPKAPAKPPPKNGPATKSMS